MPHPSSVVRSPYVLVPAAMLLVGTLLSAGMHRGLAMAAPLGQADVSCRWSVLERGATRTQHSLVEMPGVGLLAFAGGERDAGQATVMADLRRLEPMAGSRGSWSAPSVGGAVPAARAQHVAVVRPEGAQGAEMLTYGGVDELRSFGGGGGGTFTWRSPLTAAGPAPLGSQGTFAPRALIGDAARLRMNGDVATWSPLTVQARPLADAAAIWWSEGQAMLVFGGRLSEEAVSATAARQLVRFEDDVPSVVVEEDLGGPAPRYAHSAVYDPGRQWMIVFGGTRNWRNGFNDVWALDLSAGWDDARWILLEPDGRPPVRRFDHVAVWHAGLESMVVFGGTRNGQDSLDDVWWLDLAGEQPVWRELAPEGPSPAGVAGAAAAWSDAADAAVVYGGEAANSSVRDAWALSCQAAAEPTPTPRAPSPTPRPSATPVATMPPPTGGGPLYLPWGQR